MGPDDWPPGTVRVKALSDEMPMFARSNLRAKGDMPAATVYVEAEKSFITPFEVLVVNSACELKEPRPSTSQ
jgi:hypothetical protein